MFSRHALECESKQYCVCVYQCVCVSVGFVCVLYNLQVNLQITGLVRYHI